MRAITLACQKSSGHDLELGGASNEPEPVVERFLLVGGGFSPSKSGSFAIFAAILRASSLLNNSPNKGVGSGSTGTAATGCQCNEKQKLQLARSLMHY
ncbi:MAG: hypothetical protein WAV38_35485 [Xanthobacteraceae bacterium]